MLSSLSSYVVALVEYESWVEELLLCVGEITLAWPPEFRELGIDLPSPLPLSRLGVFEFFSCEPAPVSMRGAFLFALEPDAGLALSVGLLEKED